MCNSGEGSVTASTTITSLPIGDWWRDIESAPSPSPSSPFFHTINDYNIDTASDTSSSSALDGDIDGLTNPLLIWYLFIPAPFAQPAPAQPVTFIHMTVPSFIFIPLVCHHARISIHL
jgi:hypothetical protein